LWIEVPYVNNIGIAHVFSICNLKIVHFPDSYVIYNGIILKVWRSQRKKFSFIFNNPALFQIICLMCILQWFAKFSMFKICMPIVISILFHIGEADVEEEKSVSGKLSWRECKLR